MENNFKTKITFGTAGIILFYAAYLLTKMVGWVTPEQVFRVLSSERARGQVLALFQFLSQPMLVCLSVVFLFVLLGLLKKNAFISTSLWVSMFTASILIVGKMFFSMVYMMLFIYFLGPVLSVSLLLVIVGIVKNIVSPNVE